MAETDLTEDVIVNILSWLPVKSLIRFTSVSKQWRFVILSDHKFARSQLQAACQRKTLSRRFLVSTNVPQLESLDLDTLSFGDISSIRKLGFPFEQPGSRVSLLGSCNGLVFVAFDGLYFYIWNPSTRFFRELPRTSFAGEVLLFNGVGYLSAPHDYKVLAASYDWESTRAKEIKLFSLRAQVWKTIQITDHNEVLGQGTLLNEAIHWVNRDEILAFDFTQEEFRTMRLPGNDQHGVDFSYVGVTKGCLCVCGHLMRKTYGSVDIWVMREYDRYDSWTKLFNFRLHPTTYIYSSVVESTTIVRKWSAGHYWLVKIDHKEATEHGMYKIEGSSLNMIPYEESLLWINEGF